jgi:hypothetical protein
MAALASGDAFGRATAALLGAAEAVALGRGDALCDGAAEVAGAGEPPLHAATRTATVSHASDDDRRPDADRPSAPFMCSLTVTLLVRVSSACRGDAAGWRPVGTICARIRHH